MPESGRQPALHDLVTCLRAPTTVLSGADGQLRGIGAHGVFVADLRVISSAVLTVSRAGGRPPASAGGVDGPVHAAAGMATPAVEPEPVATATLGADAVEFLAVISTPRHPVPDPALWVRRLRRAEPFGCTESVTVTSVLDLPVDLDIRVRVTSDLAGIWAVRAGRTLPDRRWELTAGGAVVPDTPVAITATPAMTSATTPATTTPATTTPATTSATSPATTSGTTAAAAHHVSPRIALSGQGAGVEIGWSVRVSPRSTVSMSWAARSADPDAVVAPAEVGRLVSPLVRADDRRLAPLVDTAVADLDALRMTAVGDPHDVFIAAGSPWYLTLFGRDSLWTARMLLPLGTEIAIGTLRTLARRQGRAVDVLTGEEPGKILHELRRADDRHASLPPAYYGTVDATPLWVCLLAEAWRFGADPDEVERLLPAAERALAWLTGYGDADGDGFCEYVDRSGHGLANQGWKDSSDSVRFADGRVAVGPVALAEVQGYAHEAAVAGADLLEAFGRPGAERWRGYAAGIASRFRERFWVSDAVGPYPAMALDGDKRPVDAPASNMGHLLGTGMLSDAESAAVAARLIHPSMSSGFGLRTMATTAAGYSPLSYHCGTVWPHDTAIAIHGLLRAGFHAAAAQLADGLLAAGTAFGGRLPELYAGFGVDDVPMPVPYPAACRPQGWSAAAAVVMLHAFLGLEPDVPRGVVAVHPQTGLGALGVSGLRVGGSEMRVEVDGAGRVRAEIDGGVLRILT